MATGIYSLVYHLTQDSFQVEKESTCRPALISSKVPMLRRQSPERSIVLGKWMHSEVFSLKSSPNEADEDADNIYRALLKNELFGDELSANTSMMDTQVTPPRVSSRTSLPPATPKTPSRNLLTFMSPTQRDSLTPGSGRNSNGSGGSNRSGDLPTRDIYSLSPIRFDSQRLLLSPRREPRTISKVPFKVLDAPELKDDFYLNLVDWGSQNILAVGLGSSVYLWNAQNGIVQKLVDLGDQDHITGIGWMQRGTHLAVGTNKGLVRIWDTESSKAIRTMTGHTQRVGEWLMRVRR